MAENITKKGIDSILLFRILEEAANVGAVKIAYQVEHENSISIDTETSQTKDGVVQSLGAIEYDFSMTSKMSKNDPMVKKLKRAMLDKKLIEIWEIETDEKNEEGKYAATYYQGYISSYTKTASAEEDVELELEFAINGVGKEGFATLTEEQSKAVEYVFTDTTAVTENKASKASGKASETTTTAETTTSR